MPNPLSYNLASRAQIHIGRNASALQMLTFESSDTAFSMEVRGVLGLQKYIIHLEPAIWRITHHFKVHADFSEWSLGKGQKVNERILAFDDGGEGEGDYDFNDIMLHSYYAYNDPGSQYQNYRITVIRGNPDLSYKPPS